MRGAGPQGGIKTVALAVRSQPLCTPKYVIFKLTKPQYRTKNSDTVVRGAFDMSF